MAPKLYVDVKYVDRQRRKFLLTGKPQNILYASNTLLSSLESDPTFAWGEAVQKWVGEIKIVMERDRTMIEIFKRKQPENQDDILYHCIQAQDFRFCVFAKFGGSEGFFLCRILGMGETESSALKVAGPYPRFVPYREY